MEHRHEPRGLDRGAAARLHPDPGRRVPPVLDRADAAHRDRPGQPDAVADRRQQARSFAQRHPSYEEISIQSVDYRGYEAADWEFTYEGLRVINRVFVVDGTGHSLFFQTKQGDFAQARADFDGIAAAFRPVGG
jgi:hypothetical protein